MLLYSVFTLALVFTPTLSIYTDTWHVILDIWFMTLALGIYTGTQYLHRHLACYTWYMIYDTDTRYLHRHSVFTPTLGMLHLIYDLWHWHSVFTPALDIWNLSHSTWYLDTSTRYMSPDPDTRYMTCFHVVQVHWLDIVTLDLTLPPLIPVLYDIFMTIIFTETWHDYYIITRYVVLLCS